MIEFHRRSEKNSAYMEAWDVGAAGFVDPNVHRDPEDDDRISAWWAAANELHEELNIDLDALPSRERYYFFGIGRIKSVGGVDILGYCDATDKVIPDIRAVRSARVSEFARCKAEPEVVAQFVLEKRHWVPTALVTLVLTLEHLGFPRVRIAHAFRILESSLLLEPGAE